MLIDVMVDQSRTRIDPIQTSSSDMNLSVAKRSLDRVELLVVPQNSPHQLLGAKWAKVVSSAKIHRFPTKFSDL